MRILGLDISTSTIGIAVISDDYKLIHNEYYKPEKLIKPTPVEEIKRNIDARTHILKIAKEYNVDKFAIEEFIRFMKGGSTASTIIPLALLNRTICTGIVDTFGVYPEIINVLSVRSRIKTPGEKAPQKEDVPEVVAKILNLEEFPYEFKSKKRNLKGASKKVEEQVKLVENWDMADAMAVAIALLRSPAKKSPKSGTVRKLVKK